jgi:hypothetical protein
MGSQQFSQSPKGMPLAQTIVNRVNKEGFGFWQLAIGSRQRAVSNLVNPNSSQSSQKEKPLAIGCMQNLKTYFKNPSVIQGNYFTCFSAIKLICIFACQIYCQMETQHNLKIIFL